VAILRNAMPIMDGPRFTRDEKIIALSNMPANRAWAMKTNVTLACIPPP